MTGILRQFGRCRRQIGGAVRRESMVVDQVAKRFQTNKMVCRKGPGDCNRATRVTTSIGGVVMTMEKERGTILRIVKVGSKIADAHDHTKRHEGVRSRIICARRRYEY